MMKGKTRKEATGVVAERLALNVWKAKADFHRRSKKGSAVAMAKLVLVGKKGQPLKRSRIEVTVKVDGKIVETYKTTSLDAYSNKIELLKGEYAEVVVKHIK